MRKTINYILVSLLLTGCIYPYTPELDEAVNQDLVIDATILLGNRSSVNLSYLQPLEVGQRSANVGYPSATVYLEDEAGNLYNATGNDGYYSLNVPESAVGKCRLTVICKEKVYRSQWVTPVEPPKIKGVSFSASDDLVYVKLSMEDEGNGFGYASVQYDEIWHFHADYVRAYSYDPESNSVSALMRPDMSRYWCWMKLCSQDQTTVDYTAMDGKVQEFVFQRFLRSNYRSQDEYNIQVKVWNLTADQYKYLKQQEDNASIGGNLFSPEPGEVRGNIFCETDPDTRVYGYVNISKVAVAAATLPGSYNKWRPAYQLWEISKEEWNKYYLKDFMPVEEIISQNGGTVVGWGHARCFDCIAAGGTLEKPVFD